MTVTVPKIANVLAAFAGEHGLPNAIGVTELAQLLTAPRSATMRLGRIFRYERTGLNQELEKHGLIVTAYGRSKDGTHMVASLEAAGSKY